MRGSGYIFKYSDVLFTQIGNCQAVISPFKSNNNTKKNGDSFLKICFRFWNGELPHCVFTFRGTFHGQYLKWVFKFKIEMENVNEFSSFWQCFDNKTWEYTFVRCSFFLFSPSLSLFLLSQFYRWKFYALEYLPMYQNECAFIRWDGFCSRCFRSKWIIYFNQWAFSSLLHEKMPFFFAMLKNGVH